jgi:hypothetical protein
MPSALLPENVAAFDEFLGQRKLAAKKVHYMLGSHLDKINVIGLSKDAWPDGQAMNAAVTDAVRRKALMADAGVSFEVEPFVCVDLRNFEPKWVNANELKDDLDDPEGKPKAKNKQRQATPRWNIAYDKWALFAAARGHLAFAKCLEHKEVCQKIAFRAQLGSKPRKAVLGVIYDEMARAKWAARCMQDPFFKPDEVAGVLDEAVLREAEVAFDYENWQTAPVKSHAAIVTCYKCGKPGHMANECFSKGKGGGKDGKGNKIICYKCGEEGHKSTECPRHGQKRKFS